MYHRICSSWYIYEGEGVLPEYQVGNVVYETNQPTLPNRPTPVQTGRSPNPNPNPEDPLPLPYRRVLDYEPMRDLKFELPKMLT